MSKIINNEVERLFELREMIKEYDKSYDMGLPVVTDSEYDDLYMELTKLEEKYPEYYDENSPTQKIIGEIVSGLKKVKHTIPMLSQEKAKTEEVIRKFCKRANMKKGIIVSFKLDGLTIVIRFQNGKPKLFISRGDGYIGEDLTHSISPCFNKKVNYDKNFEIRGEAIIPFKDFERVNINGEYKSPRNLVSGSVRTLDGSIAKQRGVKVITFDTIDVDGKEFDLDTERFEWLKSLGIEIVPYEVFYDEDSLVEYCLSFNEKVRPTLPYMIDGLILTFNDLSIREELGFTSKYPKWGIAFKFESQDAITQLKEVVWQVGKTGILTPVANFDSVDIDGVSVSKASLHNIQNVKNRDIKIGDYVLVERANDVIPQVVSSYEERRNGEEKDIEMPTICPICKTPIHIKKVFDRKLQQEVEYVFCINNDCDSQLVGKIQHFVSRDAMNIDGLGDSTVELLYEKGFIRNVLDIYRLKDVIDIREKLLTLDKFGEKKVNNLLEGIEKSKTQPFSKVLYGLSIPNLGETNSKALTQKYQNLDVLLAAFEDTTKFYEELIEIKDFGPIIVDSIITWLREGKNTLLVLKTLGLEMIEEIVEIKNNDNITGKTFVVTGDVEHFKNRKELSAKIEELGGKVSGSVSSKTNYLINNDTTSTSGKNKKAKELNIPIINEQDFLNMI